MINVVIGIIVNAEGKLLIAKRPMNRYAGGLWEFPGGKIEKDETTFEALQREIFEELNLQVISANPWLKFEYAYPDRTILLNVWKIETYSGTPQGAEGQEIRWVMVEQLHEYDFPAGNHLILEKLQDLE